MQNANVLVVEDDADINRLLMLLLKKEGLRPIQAYSGTEAKLILQAKEVDLVLLDLMLPGLTGEELIAYIREELGRAVPIIAITAKASVEDKVAVLGLGADDYITKPFVPEEVLARIGAALRRSKAANAPADAFTHRDLSLNRASRSVLFKGHEIELTAHEFDLLEILIQAPDTVFSRERLYQMVWDSGYYGEDNTINVHVSNIRKKLAAVSDEEYIKTIWGIGFKLV